MTATPPRANRGDFYREDVCYRLLVYVDWARLEPVLQKGGVRTEVYSTTSVKLAPSCSGLWRGAPFRRVKTHKTFCKMVLQFRVAARRLWANVGPCLLILTQKEMTLISLRWLNYSLTELLVSLKTNWLRNWRIEAVWTRSEKGFVVYWRWSSPATVFWQWHFQSSVTLASLRSSGDGEHNTVNIGPRAKEVYWNKVATTLDALKWHSASIRQQGPESPDSISARPRCLKLHWQINARFYFYFYLSTWWASRHLITGAMPPGGHPFSEVLTPPFSRHWEKI